MNKFLAVAVLLLAVSVQAAPPPGKGGGRDKGHGNGRPVENVTWGGKVAAGTDTSQMSGNAKIRASGEVDGQAEFHLAQFGVTTTIHAVVDCLSVSGTQAWMSGTITHSSDPKLVGVTLLWTVVDGGEPSEGVDFGAFMFFVPPLDCATQPALTLLPWVEGNVQIHGAHKLGALPDPGAQPAPATRSRWGAVKAAYR